MARKGLLVLRDVDYAALFPITGDTSGGAYTVGVGLEIPGIRKLEVKPDMMKDELYGSARILDVYSKAKKATFSVENAVLSLDVLEAITGGTSISTGTSPNEQREFIWSSDDQIPYFSLVCKCNYQGGELAGGVGDSLFWLWKVKMENFSVGLKMDGYAIASFDGSAISTNFVDVTANKRKLFSIFERQAAAPITLTADTTPPTLTSVTLDTAGGTALVNGDTGIPVTSKFVFNYSEDLHPVWVNAAEFTITNATTGADVATIAPVLAAGGHVTVQPVANLAASTVYIVSDTTQVRDKAGNLKGARSTRRFTTA